MAIAAGHCPQQTGVEFVRASRGSLQRIVPFNAFAHVIVDGFAFATPHREYLLTHYHSDHTIGARRVSVVVVLFVLLLMLLKFH